MSKITVSTLIIHGSILPTMEIVYTDNITIFMMRSSPVNERRTFVPEKGAVERPANSLGISVHSSVKGQQTSFTVSRKQVSLLII